MQTVARMGWCRPAVWRGVLARRAPSRRAMSAFPDPVSRSELSSQYDAIIVGGGHNGLVSAAYLAEAGLKVCVLERRHLLGGAAVTEEIVPGFKFSRASYLLSLLRPQVVNDLELKKYGLKVYLRDPNSFTPQLTSPLSLTLGRDMAENQRQIAQFSQRDAQHALNISSGPLSFQSGLPRPMTHPSQTGICPLQSHASPAQQCLRSSFQQKDERDAFTRT